MTFYEHSNGGKDEVWVTSYDGQFKDIHVLGLDVGKNSVEEDCM
jgi:hypothetical protein